MRYAFLVVVYFPLFFCAYFNSLCFFIWFHRSSKAMTCGRAWIQVFLERP
jgi:hypothetical protein